MRINLVLKQAQQMLYMLIQQSLKMDPPPEVESVASLIIALVMEEWQPIINEARQQSPESLLDTQEYVRDDDSAERFLRRPELNEERFDAALRARLQHLKSITPFIPLLYSAWPYGRQFWWIAKTNAEMYGIVSDLLHGFATHLSLDEILAAFVHCGGLPVLETVLQQGEWQFRIAHKFWATLYTRFPDRFADFLEEMMVRLPIIPRSHALVRDWQAFARNVQAKREAAQHQLSNHYLPQDLVQSFVLPHTAEGHLFPWHGMISRYYSGTGA